MTSCFFFFVRRRVLKKKEICTHTHTPSFIHGVSLNNCLFKTGLKLLDPNKNQEKMLTSEISLYCLDAPQILLNIFRQKQSHILGFKVGESAVALLDPKVAEVTTKRVMTTLGPGSCCLISQKRGQKLFDPEKKGHQTFVSVWKEQLCLFEMSFVALPEERRS